VLLAERRFREAEAVCRELLARDPDDAATVNILGVVLRRRGRRADAAALFAQARRGEPGNATYRRNAAQATVFYDACQWIAPAVTVLAAFAVPPVGLVVLASRLAQARGRNDPRPPPPNRPPPPAPLPPPPAR
jgi:predicted Zn-dependent protease